MTTEVEISVVVPVYNSAASLPFLTERISQSLSNKGLSFEILLIDDGSLDESWGIICRLCNANPLIKGYKMPQNSGQFVTIISGTALAIGKYIVHIDDDLEYSPEDIPLLHEKIDKNNLAVVFGIAKEKYALQGANPKLSRWRNRFINFLWQKYPTDSFRIISRSILFSSGTFLPRVHFEAFIKQKVSYAQIGYVPVLFNRRLFGSSNYSFLKKLKMFFILSEDYLGIRIIHISITLMTLAIIIKITCSSWLLLLTGVFLIWLLKKIYPLPTKVRQIVPCPSGWNLIERTN